MGSSANAKFGSDADRGYARAAMGSGSRRIGVVLAVGLILAVASPARAAVWSVQPTPFSGIVSAVSCVSARFCTAVGVGEAGIGAMGWDGKRWRLQATPDSGPASEGSLAGVSCVSSRNCVAVGEYLQSLGYDPVAMHTVPVIMPLAARWNGVGWSLLPFPSLPPGAQQGGLGAVACTSGTACEAVGISGRPFAERWDGSSWSLESMPDPVPPANISQPGTNINDLSLSCSSGSFCTAVGGYDLNSGGGQSFAERWDGSSWSLGATPEIAGASYTDLSGVSCTSSRACVAVGQYNPSSSRPVQRTLGERWNGTGWSVERTPNAVGQSNELVAVSCTSNRACMAVGQTYSNAGFQPLVERWGGISWSVERTPLPGGLVQAVSCTSPVICTVIASPRGSLYTVAEQSGPASAKLSGITSACTSARFTLRVTGAGISSVAWSLDSKTIRGHSVHPGMRYVASIRLSPGRHKLAVKVKFTASSQTHALTFRRELRGCSPAH